MNEQVRKNLIVGIAIVATVTALFFVVKQAGTSSQPQIEVVGQLPQASKSEEQQNATQAQQEQAQAAAAAGSGPDPADMEGGK